MIDEFTKDWEWLAFLARYCAGKNISKAVCEDAKWWALGIAAFVVALVAWWIWGRIVQAYENWSYRRRSRKIADTDAMKKHVWSDHDAHHRK